MRRTWLALAVALGCSSQPLLPAVRFANRPAATIVDDRRDVPAAPRAQMSLEAPYSYHVLYEDKVTRALELPQHRRALGVNALDEVPDSTWFINRRELTPEQVRTGPVTLESPELHLPWTIESTKFGGSALGFVISDTRGVKYVLKFDDQAHPELETGTDAVVDRLMWASGFNVPEDQVVYLRPEQLRLAPDAAIEDRLGHHHGRLDRATVDARLGTVAHEPDGRIRGLVSRWLEGTPVGAPPIRGVRGDDPNDRIAHELRRDLRGMYVVFAWLDMVDVWAGNFLDVWVSDPSIPHRHYLKHYALDFGLSLGAMATKAQDLRRGHTYRLDWPNVFGSLASAGAVIWGWELRPVVAIPGVSALFTASDFDPGSWHADLPYPPFEAMDRFDGFWGAKLVAHFTRAQIHAAVEAGRFTDPRAVEYITDTLVARQRKTAAYWYDRVNPLDHFAVDDALCFDDLAIAQGYVAGETTTYSITPRDTEGRPVGMTAALPAGPGGRTCTALPALDGSREGYTIFEVTTVRARMHGTTYVHVARDPSGVPRVIGVWRV